MLMAVEARDSTVTFSGGELGATYIVKGHLFNPAGNNY